MRFDIHIIGGGLAGSEAAWQLAEAGFRVRLTEMRGGGDMTPAHETDRLAEMVCSNSFRSDDAEHNAVGLLHQEMRALGSLIMRAADTHRVPAGSALAVDRTAFAAEVTRSIEQHPNITIIRESVDSLPGHPAIIATGPLTGSKLAEAIAAETGEGALAFFDAIAPIVHRDSIDMGVAWMAARWDKGGNDYVNCPLDKPQYEDFVAALVAGEKMPFHDWEKDTPYFEGCMPIRNSFINSPRLLDRELRLKSKPNIRFAGQITGCEGYVESAAVGLLAARFAAAELRSESLPPPPVETALGALLGHITGGADAETFQPMNVNFGLMPPITGRWKRADRKNAYTDRARAAFAAWLEQLKVREPA